MLSRISGDDDELYASEEGEGEGHTIIGKESVTTETKEDTVTSIKVPDVEKHVDMVLAVGNVGVNANHVHHVLVVDDPLKSIIGSM